MFRSQELIGATSKEVEIEYLFVSYENIFLPILCLCFLSGWWL